MAESHNVPDDKPTRHARAASLREKAEDLMDSGSDGPEVQRLLLEADELDGDEDAL